ncbi:hypothetical protein [Halocola ammonii]
MKKFLKFLGIILLLIVAVGFILFLIYDEELPEGDQGQEATELATEMASAINFDAWEKTRFVHWKFEDVHEYWWDKKTQIVKAQWGETTVFLHTPSQTGSALRSGKHLEGNEKEEAIQKAIGYFNNDSFWLNGPAKSISAADRFAVVEVEEGRGLLTTFKSGGSTPGDSYLWILNEDGLPTSCKLWVSVIPVGGIKNKIVEWETLETGAKIPVRQKLGPMEVNITDLSSAPLEMSPEIRNNDIFEGLNLNESNYE